MDSHAFFSMVKENFAYLMESYGFRVVFESYAPSIEAGQVDFVSPWASIKIEREMAGWVLVNIAPPSKGRAEWTPLGIVARYFAPAIREPIRDRPDEPNTEKNTAMQLSRQAQILREYCEPILRENFSQWEELHQFAQRFVEDVIKEQERKKQTKS